ncbi:MAG: hypothetical protein EOS76_16570 [Mesorhizobium sp.]|uniref:hypothetical protein n=1 Tax=Mesorhizobium sp. TaxID=1871066 RepID=UPI000FE92568|nr:hypothetical protein [Mesorhizobium sp.]RWE18378.1 MAG: hypothetical protein EOS76_16570 [Mesorhizobium sp.]
MEMIVSRVENTLYALGLAGRISVDENNVLAHDASFSTDTHCEIRLYEVEADCRARLPANSIYGVLDDFDENFEHVKAFSPLPAAIEFPQQQQSASLVRFGAKNQGATVREFLHQECIIRGDARK